MHSVGMKKKKLPATVHGVESFKIIDITLRSFVEKFMELSSCGIRNLHVTEMN